MYLVYYENHLQKLGEVVLYVCETWSLTVRQIHRLKVLGRLFGPEREEVEVTREWRNDSEELHNSCSSSGFLRMIKSRKVR
jgi:hypothetical protein